jgi:glycosyltransferase involved in cell wall biosynthesis
VGDYTWRLASELRALGHRCYLLALADFHVQAPTFSSRAAIRTSRGSPGEAIPCLRLPATHSWKERVAEAKKFVLNAAPDWISWQFVLYGFDPRGFGFGLGNRLDEISHGYKNHIMFHEIWLGEAAQSTFKSRVIGKLQRFAVSDVLEKLHPRIVHTHTPLYQYLLGKLGRKAVRLPLFGNIPVTSCPNPEWLKEQWREGWDKFNLAERGDWWIFVIFGSIHPEWDAEDFWQKASAAAQRAGKKCAFIAIGRPGEPGERILRELQKHEGDSWRFLNLGAQSEEDVSQCLLTADFGVSAVPPEYLCKSGTAAAMTEHGLPVIAIRPSYGYRDCPPDMLLVGMKNVIRDFELDGVKKSSVGSILPEVAGQFIDDLQRA